MKVLIIGSGAREHALAYQFSRSKQIEELFVSPGNGGIALFFPTVSLKSHAEMIEFVHNKKIDFVVVGPEQPLAEGVVDELQAVGIAVVGPTKKAARIESSKRFAKELMQQYGIPTAKFATFSNSHDAITYCAEQSYPLVIKADGLAAGKGVVIVQNYAEAQKVLHEMMDEMCYGKAANQIVIEEFMEGWEASIFAISDGEYFQTTLFAQDHKRLLDGDEGPNTGGMGAYAPVHRAEPYRETVEKEIVQPILKAMQEQGCPFAGFLYVGLMITNEGPKVVEFNCRLGDPETQVILPLLETDLVEVCMAIIQHRVDELELRWKDKFAVTIVGAAKGYPNTYEKNRQIMLSSDYLAAPERCVYFAGARLEEGKLLTNGGRVFSATVVDSCLETAKNGAYQLLKEVAFAGMQFRNDIGNKGLIES